jgi:ABC-type antimicrobial peptide transport system permease subunit
MSEISRADLASLGVVASRLTLLDLISESWRAVARDMGRSLVAALGALLGCAAFVATLGISGTASHQISASFDIRRATEVTVTIHNTPNTADDDAELTTEWFTPAAAEKAGSISGVVHAGRITTLKAINLRRFLIPAATPVPVDVYAADSEALGAIAPDIFSGRTFDSGHVRRADPVVLLSTSVAAQLGITQPGSAVFIGDLGFTVIGIYGDVHRVPGAAAGIIVPITLEETTPMATGQTPNRELFLETVSGAATQVAQQAPLAISPTQPDLIDVNAPPDPKTLRQEIEGSMTQLSLLVSFVTLVLGAVSIGNTTVIGVVLRTSEIGLRRALGARRRDIFWQLIGETSALGVLGGVIGAVIGLVLTVSVSFANRWVPVLDPGVPLIAIAAGALCGISAGFWPAFRATTITPAHALSR